MGRRRGKFSRTTTLADIRVANEVAGVTTSVADPITIPDKVDVVVSKGSNFQVVFEYNVLYMFFSVLEPPILTDFKMSIVRKLAGQPAEYFRGNGYEKFWHAFYANDGTLDFQDLKLKDSEFNPFLNQLLTNQSVIGQVIIPDGFHSENKVSYDSILDEVQQFQKFLSFDIKLKDSTGTEHASSATLKYNETVTLPGKSYAFSAPMTDSLTAAKDGFTPNETIFYHLTDDSGNKTPLTVSATSTIAVNLSQIQVISISINEVDLKIYNPLLYTLLHNETKNKIN